MKRPSSAGNVTFVVLTALLLTGCAGPARAQATGASPFSWLYSFAESSSVDALVQGDDGNFYGTTTYGGGGPGSGTVFRLTPNGTLTTIYSFTGGAAGEWPNGLLQGSDGNLYGTTSGGGNMGANAPYGGGTVFKLTHSGALTTLHAFSGGSDGTTPWSGLIEGSDGNFYGTTTNLSSAGNGTVFKITPSGTLTTLAGFPGNPNGTKTEAGLVQGRDGNLYGTTYSGGAYYNGTVFRVTTSGSFTTLYSFTGGADGGSPEAALVQGSDGSLYGTTFFGGNPNIEYIYGGSGGGTVFRITPSGTLTTLHKFSGPEGAFPNAPLALGSDGNFYGTTEYGGNMSSMGGYGLGAVYRMTPSGETTALYDFAYGQYPPLACSLIEGADGNIYGTSPVDGANSDGGVFVLADVASVSGSPILANVSPSAASVGSSATTITLTGTNFESGSTVQWNGASLSTSYLSATQIAATIPTANLTALGTFSITALNPGPNGGTSNPESFIVTNPAATLTAVSLNATTAGAPATAITIMGTNFLAGVQAQWNGGALKTTYVSSTKLTATIPASDLTTAGSYTIAVINPGSGSVTGNTATFTVDNPAPTLSSLSPNSATAGAAGATVTLTGAKFVSASVVQWNGVALPTTYLSGTKLTATVPANDLTKAGTFNVTVVNGAPGGGVSKAATFTVNNPVPTVKSLTPASATIGGAATTVTLTGANFVPTSLVKCNGATLATVYLSATSVAATLPASDLTKTATLSLTVVTPAPGGGTSKAVSFAVINPAPTITGLSASAATAGAAALKLTVAGTGFVSGSVVRWNGAALATIFVTGTNLTATLPASDLAKSGAFNVTVVNPAPGGGTSGPAPFTVNNPVPTLLKLSQLSAAVGSANVTVTATGTGFQTTSKAQWDGVALTTTYKSASSLTFVIPKGDLVTAGTHSIAVMNPTPGGGTSSSAAFTVK